MTKYSTLHELLSTLLPEHEWDLERFRLERGHKERGWWQQKKNQREFLVKLGQELGVKEVCITIYTSN